ncbi:MAG: serpin family protein, partial [Cyanobacteria bacterium P01_A01_bin.37]
MPNTTSRFWTPGFSLGLSQGRIWLHSIIILVTIMGLSGCSQNQTIESPSPIPDAVEQSDEALPTHDDIPLTESNSQLINANHEFAYDLFASVIENRRDENVLISPASVAIALAMTQNGATGDTQQAIANTLRLQNVGLEAINEFYQALVTDVQTFAPIDQDQNEAVQNNDEVEAVQLAIANSLWGRDGFMFDESFLGRMKAIFDADLRLLDFAKPDAPAQINQWVREKTNQRISQIIDTIDADQVMFLINAVYFNGPWTTAFDPAQTRDRPFTLLDGTEIQHPLMSQMGQFSYLETEAFQAIQLPYG